MKKRTMKKILLFAVLISGGLVSAQTTEHSHSHYGPENHVKCLNNYELEQEFLADPSLKEQYEIDQANFEIAYQEYLQTFDPYARASYVIPVVVHIAHLGGVDNISNEQVYSAIEQLNADFSMSNSDLGGTIGAFSGITGNPDIEFRLATKDPFGNCHLGITRTYTPHTVQDGSSDLRNAIAAEHGNWPNKKYMNIIVCQDPNGAAGYTNYPFGNGNTMSGSIYMRHDYMGIIGTSSGLAKHTLSHEAGHWFNLAHPWGSSNNPGQASNCGTDDSVSDTPNTEGWQSCNLSGTTCSSLDNVQNIMEYSYCSTMFTQGQAARIQTALNNNDGGRNNLWTSSNLNATGTNGNAVICEADFKSDYQYICAGQTVSFNDESYHAASSWDWTFTGGTPATSTDQNPSIVYNTPGTYSVTLEVSDGSSTKTETKTNYIVVMSDPGHSLPYHEGFEDLSAVPDNDRFVVVNENEDDTWELSTTVGSGGSANSAYLNNYGEDDSSKDELISGTIDLGDVDPADPMVFNFEYAYRQRSSSNDEWLRFYISKDCGETWALRKNIHGSSLSSVVQTSSYSPQSEDEWYSVSVTNINSEYFVSNFRYKFQFENDGGNNIYIDNINLYPTSMTSIVEHESIQTLSVYPNPAKDATTIELFAVSGQDYSISLLNTLGQKTESIYQGQLIDGINLIDFNTTNLAKGIYLIRIESEGEIKTVKLIKE
jgi:PKD repeat protein